VATAGDTTKGHSLQEVSDTTGTGIAQLRLVAPVNRPDNTTADANSNWVNWVVRINENHYSRTDGVGI